MMSKACMHAHLDYPDCTFLYLHHELSLFWASGKMYQLFFMQGVKLTFFFGSHLPPKFVKVVANSKKLVAIMRHTKKHFLRFD